MWRRYKQAFKDAWWISFGMVFASMASNLLRIFNEHGLFYALSCLITPAAMALVLNVVFTAPLMMLGMYLRERYYAGRKVSH